MFLFRWQNCNMLIRRVKCPHCKEEINSFYIITGVCPICKKSFNSAWRRVSNTGLKQLRDDKKQFKKDTLSKGQVKRMFKLTEEQITHIPSTDKFGEVRYSKNDIFNFIGRK
jgi:uncharacterized protein (UPF0212 family)